MRESRHLFIGGPVDGEWLSVTEGIDTWNIKEQTPFTMSDTTSLTAVDMKSITYIKVLLREETETYVIYALPEIKPLQALIIGYGR